MLSVGLESKMLRAMGTLIGLFLLLGSTAIASPECRYHFTVVHHDGILFALGQMSEAQQKWWNQKGSKKYEMACVDATNPEYFIVWGKQIESRAVLDWSITLKYLSQKQ
jgi:hypothetical protein